MANHFKSNAMIKENLVSYFKDSIVKNWDLPSLSDYHGTTYSYKEVATNIIKLHLIYEQAGFKRGDKIAIIGKNSANWGIAYLSVVTYGAVVVPILPDFKPHDVHHIVNHSESKMLFAAEYIWSSLDADKMKNVELFFNIEELMPLLSRIKNFDNIIHSSN